MNQKAVQHPVKIKADAEGNPPTRIHLMSTGHWHAPWHGSFEMTLADLHEMRANFDAGEATVHGSKKLPINYGHDLTGKAAGWILGLEVVETSEEQGELWASEVEWTPNGDRMLRDGELRYFSPEWNPRSVPYQDPEDEDRWLNNVLTGAGLTNIPLFRKLKPIMASLVQPKVKQASVVTASDSNNNGEQSMDLEALRAKKLEDLSDDEKKFVEEHKSDLLEDERKTFGLDDEAANDGSDADKSDDSEDSADDASDADDSKSDDGGVQGSGAPTGLTAAQQREWNQMKADAAAGRKAAQELEESKVNSLLASAVSKGQIKTGESKRWSKVILASGAQRPEIESLLRGLPVNEALGKEHGDGGLEASTGARDELHTKVSAAIKASAEKGKSLKYTDAQKQVLAEDTALAARVKSEEEENK